MPAETIKGAVERQNPDAPAAKPSPSKLIANYRSDFATIVPSHVDADAFVRVAQGVMRRADKKLLQAAYASPASLMAALLDCAQLGLRPGDTYHLVPIGGKVVGIPDYTGEIELMYRTSVVASVKAEIVYSNDGFDYRPDMDRPHHEVDWWAEEGERGVMVGVYAYAIFTNGATSRVVVMNKAEVYKHRDASAGHKSPESGWNKWEPAMWLKTAIKQLRKWVPTSPEYMEQALRAQNAAEIAERRGLPVHITGVEAPEGPPLPTDESEPIDGELVDATPE
jgi:recombination protein RecT